MAYPVHLASWIVSWALPLMSTADTSPPTLSVGAANAAVPEPSEGELSSPVNPCAALYSSTTWYSLIV